MQSTGIFMIIFLVQSQVTIQTYNQKSRSGINAELWKDADIQRAMIGISRRLPKECPIVLIYDEQMPVFSVSHILMEKMESHERMFIILNISTDKLQNLTLIYGSRSSDSVDILHLALHNLYRKGKCYIFQVWLKDPRILYPDVNVHHHPGWRKSDYVILVAHHITKRYKIMINLRIWNQIPNIVGLKRNKPQYEGVAVNIFTVLPYYINGRRKSQEMDVWLVKEKGFLKNNNLFPEKFNNMHNASITLGLLWKEPFLIWGNKNDPWLDGLDWRLFMLCKNALNFTFNVANIGLTGKRISEETWTGMLGMLANGSIDVGIGGVSVTADRRQHFDFCRTYYTDSYNFIAPLNDKMSSALDTFFRPLSKEVWICTFVTVLLGILTLKAVASVEKWLMRNESDSHFNSLPNNCGFVITIFCQKPYRHLPKTTSVQSIYLGMIIMTFLLGMAFSSCLISVLLGFKANPIADKIEDILATGLPIAIKNYDGRLNDYMNWSGATPELREIFRKGKLVDYYQSSEAMDEVVKGKMIYIDSKSKIHFSGKYRYANGPVDIKFHISSESILEFDNLGWPVNQNWPFITKFDDIISRAVESGIVQHWMNRFRSGRFGQSSEAWKIPEFLFNLTDKVDTVPEVVVHVESGGKFVKLTMEHIQGVNYLYMVGIGMSVFVFIGECCTGIFTRISKLVKQYNLNHGHLKPTLEHIPSIKINDKGISRNTTKKSNQASKAIKCKRTRAMAQKIKLPDLVWDDFKRTQIHLMKKLT